MILGSQMQGQEVGDGTNFVIILDAIFFGHHFGALLEQAESLIRMGQTPNEIYYCSHREGFRKGINFESCFDKNTE